MLFDVLGLMLSVRFDDLRLKLRLMLFDRFCGAFSDAPVDVLFDVV